MKYPIFISIWTMLLSLFACQQASESTSTHSLNKSEAISDISIFNLNTAWENQHGETLQLQELSGNVLVVVMIYTTCKAACPRLVADMKNIAEKVGETTQAVKYVLVSIDPETDTPERLKQFSIDNMMDDEKWLFLRSSLENTREFANVVAVKYAQISPMDFSHSNIITVFNDKGEMVHQMEGLSVDNTETVEIIKKLAH
ncbi:MAG: SCO family protein [Chitinophagales bacterium]|nr:SCO family protein [Bacteroidota bacterium]